MKRGGGSILRRCSSSSRSKVDIAASTQSNAPKFSNLADMLRSHGLANEKVPDSRPAGAWKPPSKAEMNQNKTPNTRGAAEHKRTIQSEIQRGIANFNNRIVFDAYIEARYFHLGS